MDGARPQISTGESRKPKGKQNRKEHTNEPEKGCDPFSGLPGLAHQNDDGRDRSRSGEKRGPQWNQRQVDIFFDGSDALGTAPEHLECDYEEEHAPCSHKTFDANRKKPKQEFAGEGRHQHNHRSSEGRRVGSSRSLRLGHVSREGDKDRNTSQWVHDDDQRHEGLSVAGPIHVLRSTSRRAQALGILWMRARAFERRSASPLPVSSALEKLLASTGTT